MKLVQKEKQENLYKKLGSILNVIYNLDLKETELKVFAALCNKNYELISTIKDFDIRMLALFEKNSKKSIANKLGITYNVFNNALSKLRKKELITKETLHKGLSSIDISKDKLVISIELINEV